jgi:hypothetical protein
MDLGNWYTIRESFKKAIKEEPKIKVRGKSRYSKCCISFIGITV